MTLSILAQAAEGGSKGSTLWYPTIIGVLVVVAAVVLFCGSVYLLLATNLGARLGFLVAFAGLMGILLLLSMLWTTTSTPLDTLKGRVPDWAPIEKLGPDLAASKVPLVREFDRAGHEVPATEAANVKAAVDAALVTQTAIPTQPLAPNANKFAAFSQSTDYLVTSTREGGGGGRFKATWTGSFPWLNLSFHKPKYAVVTVCPVDQAALKVPVGQPLPAPTCDSSQPVTHLVLELDLGSMRVPPMVVFFSTLILFALSLLLLHWRERDEQERRAAEALERGSGAAGELEPAKV